MTASIVTTPEAAVDVDDGRSGRRDAPERAAAAPAVAVVLA